MELAGNAIDRPGIQQRLTGDGDAGRELSLLRIDVQLDDGHGRNRAEEMWVKHFDQRLGDLRKFVVDFQVQARGEKGERLQHTLDVRIFAAIRFQHETIGDLRVFARKLRAHLA